eukprot:g5932.t1
MGGEEITLAEVAKHNTQDDCWVVLGEPGSKQVYDVTKFLDDHPGGPEIVLDKAGEDAHSEFEDIGHSMDARDMLKPLLKGKLKEDPEAVAKAKAAAEAKSASGGGGGMLYIAIFVVIAAVLYMQFGQ